MLLLTFSLIIYLSSAQSPWTQLALDDCSQDQDIQDLLQFGSQYIVREAIKQKSLQDDSYQVSKILNIAKQILTDGSINYRCKVFLTNSKNDTKPATFLILHQTKTNTKRVASFSIALGPANPKQKSPEGELYQLQLEDLVAEYQAIDLMELEEDQGLQDLLNFGFHHVINEGIDEGLIPNGEYEITEVFSVGSQGVNYYFEVEVRNGDGLFEKIDFIVFDQVWNNVKKVMNYDFLSRKK